MKTSIFCLFVTLFSLSANAQICLKVENTITNNAPLHKSHISINGTVSNTFKEKLHNSHISIKGTAVGTVSENGRFSIIANKKDTLVVSHLGYMVKEIPVTNYNMAITLDVESLNEVLIQAFSLTDCVIYGCSLRRRCGGCSTKVTATRYIEPKTFNTNVATLCPNPSISGYFNIKLPDTFNEVKLQVYSLQGQLLQTSSHQRVDSTIQIDLSPYATGMYLINIDADGESLPAIRAIKG